MNKNIQGIRTLPFWFLTASVFVLLFGVNAFKNGMFMDGLIYSTVARNMATGIGSFWSPSFTASHLNHFFEHPPLAMGIQALFFKLFGDSLMVERIYSLMAAIITLYIIVLLWRQTFKENDEIYAMGWLPCLLWCVLPLNVYSFSNNMLENTMGVFTLSAICFLVKYMSSPRYPYVLLAGIMVFLGLMSKGPAALFPLLFFGSAFLVFRRYSLKQSLVLTAILTIVPLALLMLTSVNESGRRFWVEYLLNKQVIPSLLGQRSVNDAKRYYILVKLVWAIVPIGLPGMLSFIYVKRQRTPSEITNRCRSWGLFYILLGLSASVPLAVSAKQFDHYLVPSLPLFALGFAAFMAPAIEQLLHRLMQRLNLNNYGWSVLMGSFLVCTVLYTFSQVGEVKSPHCSFANAIGNVLPAEIQQSFSTKIAEQVREERRTIEVVEAAGKIVPRYETIGVPKEIWTNWSLQGYFARYYNIGLTMDKSSMFFIENRKLPPKKLEGYEKVRQLTEDYELYRRIL